MIYAKLPDGSDNPDWLAARCGVITASEMYRAVSLSKLVRSTYLNEKLTERLTGKIHDHFVTDAMRRGLELEPIAGQKYAEQNGVDLIQGYWIYDERGFGATPDYFVDGGGMIEIKCPKAVTAVAVLFGEELLDAKNKYADKYFWQCAAQMAAADEDWCDLTFYCPDLARYGLEIQSKRIERDAKLEARMCNAVVECNNAIIAAFEVAMAPKYRWISEEAIPEIQAAQSVEAIQRVEGEIYKLGKALPKALETAVDEAIRERMMVLPSPLMG